MVYYPTIAKYILKQFFKNFVIVSLAVIAIILIGNIFDMTQKFKTTNLPTSDFWQLIMLKIPYLYNEIIPLTAFLSALLFLHNIYSKHELIILLSSGVSIWQFFMIPIIATFIIGIIMTTIVGPFGAYSFTKYVKLEIKLNDSKNSNIIVSEDGLFFFETRGEVNRIIHTKSINIQEKKLTDVIVLFIDKNNNLIKRIDAPNLYFGIDEFTIHHAKIFIGKSVELVESATFPTSLSPQMLLQKFDRPEAISFWRLLAVIDNFNNLGLPVQLYKAYFYKQLFKPLIMLSMVFLALMFINTKSSRTNKAYKRFLLGMLLGSFMFILLEVIFKFLIFSGASALVATLLPTFAIILFSNFVILHFQEA